MAIEASTIGSEEVVNDREIAYYLDEQAKNNVASRQSTIHSIAEEQQRLVELALVIGIHFDSIVVQRELAALQRARMEEVMHDSLVQVGHLDDGVAGLYDSEGDTVLDVDHIEKGVAKHEFQHREDGGIDETLDKPLVHETGIAKIDAQLDNFGTRRDVLEERAMDAAGEIPEAYRHTHWATVKKMEQRGEEVGVDMEDVNNRLIEQQDRAGFQKAAAYIAVEEIAGDDPEQLIDMAEQAEQVHNDVVSDVIAEVRKRYEEGPKSAKEIKATINQLAA